MRDADIRDGRRGTSKGDRIDARKESSRRHTRTRQTSHKSKHLRQRTSDAFTQGKVNLRSSVQSYIIYLKYY